MRRRRRKYNDKINWAEKLRGFAKEIIRILEAEENMGESLKSLTRYLSGLYGFLSGFDWGGL